MPVNTPAVFYRGTPAYVGATAASTLSRAVTTAALTSNLVTLTLGTTHGLSQVGTLISVQGVGTSYDGIYPVFQFPTTSTLTYVKTASNISSASVTPNGSAIFNTGVTVGGAISNAAVTNYTAIVTTSAAHNLSIGDVVAVNCGVTGVDTGAAIVTAVPSATIFTFNSSTLSVASTAISQGAFGKYPVAYTAPASTTIVATNAVLTNPSAVSAAQYQITIDGTPVVSGLSVPVNSSTVVDFKQYAATGKTITIGTTVPSATATISGMTMV